MVPPILIKNDVFNTGNNYIYLSAGPTDIHVDPGFVDQSGGDFHLLNTSPCIDAGDNGSIPTGLPQDYDGKPRVWDGNRDGNAVVDIGAYEVTYPVKTDFNGDWKPDILWRNSTNGQNAVWYLFLYLMIW